MSTSRSATHELLTITDIVRQCRIPRDMIRSAIIGGELRSIDGPVQWRSGSTDSGRHFRYVKYRPRYYIPRHMVEEWIDKKARIKR